MILFDTSGLLSAIDASQRQHARCVAVIGGAEGALLLSPFVLAELDYLLSVRVGTAARRMLLDEVARGAYRLEPFSAIDVATALDVIVRYGDLDIGLADASIVVLAARHGVRDVLILDDSAAQLARSAAGASNASTGRLERVVRAPTLLLNDDQEVPRPSFRYHARSSAGELARCPDFRETGPSSHGHRHVGTDGETRAGVPP